MKEHILVINESGAVELDPQFMFANERTKILRAALGMGLAPMLRGKHLDLLLSPLGAGASDAARRRAFDNVRAVAATDDGVPIVPDTNWPEPNLMEDIKISGGPAELARLANVLGYDGSQLISEVDAPRPKFLQWIADARQAWQANPPKRRAQVRFTTIPEPPHIPYIRLDHTIDFFGLPEGARITSPADIADFKFGRPFQIIPMPLTSLSITAASTDDAHVPDLRNPLVATNIDALTAPFSPTSTELEPMLPTLPKRVVLHDRAQAYWKKELTRGNPFAPYGLLDVISRGARKAAFHTIPWDEATREGIASLAALAQKSWANLRLDALTEMKLRWEWETAHAIDPGGTKNLIKRFRVPKMLHPRHGVLGS